MVLDVNSGFHFELSWYSCFPLCNSEQKKLNKHFSLNEGLRSILFTIFEDQMES